MLIETATAVATVSLAAYGYKRLYQMVAQEPEEGGEPWTRGELSDDVKLEYLTEADIQRIQYIQTQQKYFEAVKNPNFPKEELCKGLFTMAVLIIPRTEYINGEINFVTKLQKSGMVGESAVQTVKDEVEEIQQEIAAIRQEAARLRPGWDGSIFQDAMGFREQQKKQQEQTAAQQAMQQQAHLRAMQQKAAAEAARQRNNQSGGAASSDDDDLPVLVTQQDDDAISDPEL